MQTYSIQCLSGDEIVETGEYEAKDDSEAIILFHLRREKNRLRIMVRRAPSRQNPKGRHGYLGQSDYDGLSSNSFPSLRSGRVSARISSSL